MKNKWYETLIIKNNLADYSSTKGCIIIKPYGYNIWNNIKKNLNKKIINIKYKNIYFPLLINNNIFKKYLIHKNGFKKEKINIKIHKNKYILRPTSESIIWYKYKKYIKSYKNLPILLNQWVNTIRWEKKNKFFLRNNEFILQEAHSGYKNKKYCLKEIKKIIILYKLFFKKYLSLYTISGIKPKSDKFFGAIFTISIETFNKKNKSIQLATIHYLGKNFSKIYNVKYINKYNKYKYIYNNSWGISTRLIGAIIINHSDKYGLIIPPKIAPIKIIIILIWNNNIKINIKIYKYFIYIKNILKKYNITYKYNLNKLSPKKKFIKYEKKGIPIRITIGKKEFYKKKIEIFSRDNFKKKSICYKILIKYIINLLNKIQKRLYLKNKIYIKKNIINVKNIKNINKNNNKIISTYWDGSKKSEKNIKKISKLSIRCINYNNLYNYKKIYKKCIYSKKKTFIKIYLSKSY
ncbi:MAG: aminoacyl--tRNA ligase-related protein [Candidatus Shikimatogenerans sp. Tcar]|uniref:Proline--tRNA ligase n=1 Tax=Candidatus Shikimatogenerans sp. Tcar TaxID=3158565 RepID=A0AAU7QRW6_9FLAO